MKHSNPRCRACFSIMHKVIGNTIGVISYQIISPGIKSYISAIR